MKTDRHLAVQIVIPRVKIGCGFTWICTYRSPGEPPCSPTSPSPVSRIRSPLSTPAGTLTDSVFCSSIRPLPRQVSQGRE